MLAAASSHSSAPARDLLHSRRRRRQHGRRRTRSGLPGRTGRRRVEFGGRAPSQTPTRIPCSADRRQGSWASGLCLLLSFVLVVYVAAEALAECESRSAIFGFHFLVFGCWGAIWARKTLAGVRSLLAETAGGGGAQMSDDVWPAPADRLFGRAVVGVMIAQGKR